MQTTKRTVERLGYLAGALFPVVMWASIAMEEEGRPYPEFEEGPIGAQALRDFFDISTVNAIGGALGIISIGLLVWFAGALYVRSGRISDAARSGGLFTLIAAVVFSALVAIQSGPSLLASQYDANLVDPAVLLTWLSGSELLGGVFVGAFLGLAAMLGAYAHLGFAHAVVPRWTAWPAAVLASTMAFGTVAASFGDLGFIAWLSFMAFTLWILVVGIRLAVRPGDAIATRRSRKSSDRLPEVPVPA